MAVDYETTPGTIFTGARVFSYSQTDCETGETIIGELPKNLAELEALWEDANVEKVAHNLKFELHHTAALGIVPQGQLHDTMIMHQLLENLAFGHHGLDDIANEFGSPEDITRWERLDRDVKSAAFIYKDYSKIPSYIMHPYQEADGERTALIFGVMFPMIKADPRLYKIYLNEIELIKVTVRMERVGIMVSKPDAEKLLTRLQKDIDDIEAKWAPVNLSSPKQLIKLLFEDNKLPMIKGTSTDAEVIKILAERYPLPLLQDILKSRAYIKGKAMVRSYIEAAGETGILHPNINTNHNRTGRQSSDSPNMQNVSNDVSARASYPVPARCCFRARPKTVLISKDYSGIEMRLGVQGTGSPRLIKLCEEDFDFHAACATSFYGERFTKAGKKEQKLMRYRAKNGARFPMFYGAGPETISKGLGLSYEETLAGIARDKKDFPEFYEFMSACTLQARKHGWIETFFGRKLYVPEDRPYAATDYCIQGSAAQILKIAQVRVDRYLHEKLHDKARMLLPVHDEIILEYPRSLFPQREEILHEIDELMIHFDEITVKLTVETEMSTLTWDKGEEL